MTGTVPHDDVPATGLREVTASRGGTVALAGLTLLAGPGELVAVLGPSGSGKTTALRVLAGLEEADRGEVLVGGRPVTGLPPGRRGAAMVFESTALVPFLDVARNLGWSLERRVPREEAKARVDDRSRRLRIRRLLPRRPDTLSEGERALVGIGRALVHTPEVFLLDEPLAHLDAAGRVEVRKEIVSVVRDLGVTTFWVTHDQAEALSVADRAALLDGGSLAQVGTPAEVYARPASLLVAGFVGAPAIGLLPARLVVSGGHAGFETGGRTLPLWGPVPAGLAAYAGREVVLGFRAEDVADGSGAVDPAAVVLPGVATTVEFTGRRTEVAAAIGAPPVTAPGARFALGAGSGATLRVFFPPRSPLRRGDGVRLAVDARRAHVFDPDTGRALHHPG
jgi:multiple sugar transport system ATP-binding protein